MITACRLFFVALIRRGWRSVVLKRAQHDQVVVEAKCSSSFVPNETIDAIAQLAGFRLCQPQTCLRRDIAFHREEFIRRSACAATSPVQIHARVGGKIKMQRDAE